MCDLQYTLVSRVFRGDIIFFTDTDGSVRRALVKGVQGRLLRVQVSTGRFRFLEPQQGQQYWLSLRQVVP